MERLTRKGETYAGGTGKLANALRCYEDLLEQYNIPDLPTLETLLKANAEGRRKISTLAIGQKLYKLDDYGGIQEWDVCAVDIGGCAGETWLCERDFGTEVYTFDIDDLKHGVIFLTRQEAEDALEKEKSNE